MRRRPHFPPSHCPGSFLVQNRSHYVNSSTSTQFRALDAWLAQHAAALHRLLGAPGLFVLFGEWLYARHSLAYTHLPDYFLAFDLMHAPSGRLLSRRDFRRRLWLVFDFSNCLSHFFLLI